MPSRRHSISFYSRSALRVAPDLLGSVLYSSKRGRVTAGIIVEVEAYLGSNDPASHAYRGRTSRNAAMFGPGGQAYVYFTYGNHFCVNVVTGKEGEASAVLIRALEPLEGIDLMKKRRRRERSKDLASGPGKLTQAMGIDRSENGESLSGRRLWIEKPASVKKFRISRSSRIGITKATERLYRYFIAGSPFVSR